MESIYSTAEICKKRDDCYRLDPGLTDLMLTSDDYCELQWAWEGWRNESGRKMRGYYTSYVLLQNEAAEVNGYKNAKEMWTSTYLKDEEKFYEDIEQAWQGVKPLYQQLHQFARKKLIERYGKENFPDSGHIPAHLFGNMWAQDWDGLYSLMVPYPDAPKVDITTLMKNAGWTIDELFDRSDDFFRSIGLDPMTDDFWDKSVRTKPEGKEMVCHASAWDFYGKTDFRIKMCTVLTSGDFQTVHHEMGHIQYFMQYKDQPIEFREGANPGFHEAIGDLIALSVMTPGHLKSVGLLPQTFEEDEQTNLNALMAMALNKVSFLPFGYLMDKYRWDIFEGNTSLSKLNQAWWNLRCEMQGVSPPVPRNEGDFDAGSKYHIPASVPYIRYFFSHIAQFQFHKAICNKINPDLPLHQCDIYNNTAATKEFRDAMALGASTPYPEVMKTLTGSSTLNASALLEYFSPLMDWLEEQNGGKIEAWEPACSVVTRNKCEYPSDSNCENGPSCDNDGANALGWHLLSLLPVVTYFFLFQ